MRLTPEEINFFQDISGTEMGNFLVSYLKKVQGHAFDAREWKEGDDVRVANRVSDILQKNIIDKIHKKLDNTVISEIYE